MANGNVKFRIYYADGSAFGDEQGTWEDAPVDGVIMVAVKDPKDDRVYFLAGTDHYARIPGTNEVSATDDEGTIVRLDGLAPTVREYCPWIKHGVWTTHANYERIQQRAREEWAGEGLGGGRQ